MQAPLNYLYGYPERAVPVMCLLFSHVVALWSGSVWAGTATALVTLGVWRVASAYLVIQDDRLGRLKLRCPDPFVWLTFDDGPGPQTLDIVRTLNRYEFTATFFFIGEQLESYPRRNELVEALLEGGHSVANHSFTHPNFLKQTASEARRQLEHTHALLEGVFGDRALAMFRPPFGYRKASTFEQASALDLELVGWSVNSLDFMDEPPESILARLKKQIRSGSIVLFHDGRDKREVTLATLPDLLKWLKASGYQAYNPLL